MSNSSSRVINLFNLPVQNIPTFFPQFFNGAHGVHVSFSSSLKGIINCILVVSLKVPCWTQTPPPLPTQKVENKRVGGGGGLYVYYSTWLTRCWLRERGFCAWQTLLGETHIYTKYNFQFPLNNYSINSQLCINIPVTIQYKLKSNYIIINGPKVCVVNFRI